MQRPGKTSRVLNSWTFTWHSGERTLRRHHYRDSEKQGSGLAWADDTSQVSNLPSMWEGQLWPTHRRWSSGLQRLIPNSWGSISYLRRLGLPAVDLGIQHLTPQIRKPKSDRKCLLINSSYYPIIFFEKKKKKMPLLFFPPTVFLELSTLNDSVSQYYLGSPKEVTWFKVTFTKSKRNF